MFLVDLILIINPLSFLIRFYFLTKYTHMGRLFTSPRTRLFLAIIMVDLIIILDTAFPVIPVSSSEVMFVLQDHSLENRTYVYRWFKLEAGNKIHIDFTTNHEVNAHPFTKTSLRITQTLKMAQV